MVLEIVSTSTTRIIAPLRATSLPINNIRGIIPRSASLKSFEKHLQTRCFAKQISESYTLRRAVSADFNGSSLKPNMLGIMPDPPIWPEREQVMQEVMRETIERRANCMDFPFSLRMIKKKENKSNYYSKPVNHSESTNSSVNNAFFSMASIVIAVQNHALQAREAVSSEDHQAIINRVQTEMRGSFACIFQQVFSRTPCLMTDVMILLSDFCVHSVLNGMAAKEENRHGQPRFDLLGGNYHEVAELKTIFPSSLNPNKDDANVINDEEIELWKSMVEEAGYMQEELTNDAKMICSSRVEIELDNYREFSMTDLTYQMNLFEDPHNPLLLCNYAQFLQLVTHDYDRAEECYKRAIQLEPTDAFTLNQYANFLWIVRNDLWTAEEQYQEAIAAEPENAYYISAYANFLWNTGGEDTCYPSDKP
ncbi:uncharacterized protein LOC124935230 [Impatiens glandulifera]|uniref:uncharacterized protein LOC124935230 n=1 Tax=Impatiens glandulifera TaxID=253017 RepID=UPI001FB0A980|nr:uncharacterized protein LOC124935230 [Impatiens glandulifera]